MRLTTPRIPPLPKAEWTDEVRELLGTGVRLNLFTTLARHPKLFKRWSVFGAHVLSKSTLPVRERELVILRTGYRCNSAYEFHQHTRLGLAAGLTAEEIQRLRGPIEGFDARDTALLRAADELHDDQMIRDETWRALCESWDEKQRIDLIFAVGQYTLACMVLNSLGVQIEASSADAAR